MIFIAIDDALAAIMAITDPIKESTPEAIAALHEEGVDTRFIQIHRGKVSNYHFVLRYESAHTASLQGLVRFVEDAEAEIKRDMDQGRPEIRVMTVHGAKGLEAPIVILADTLTTRSATHAPRILELDPPDGVPGKPGPLVWNVRKPLQTAVVSAAAARRDDAEDEEARRLLYVALTRARDRLYIAGHNTKKDKPADEQDGHWYATVHGVLRDKATPVADPYRLGFDVWRFGDLVDPGHDAERAPGALPEAAERPAWLDTPARPESAPPRLTAPSSAWPAASADTVPPEPPPPDPLSPEPVHRAAERGRIIHRLLQSLPDLAAASRADAADRHLARADGWTEAERTAMRDEALRLIATDELAPLFASGARAEVPVTGTVETGAGPLAVAGIIDRVAVLPDRVLVADFKTNAVPPETLDAVPDAYRVQMAVYRRLLGALYPDRPVEAVLVWTATATAMPLPGGWLDAALALPS